MKSNVEVVKVETVKAGKTDRIVLHYKAERTKGEAWKVGALAVKLTDASRKVLAEAKAGDIITTEIVKDGNYYNLASAETTTATSTAKVTKSYSSTPAATFVPAGRLTDVEKSEGAQRGNVLTNAVTIATNLKPKTVGEALALVEEAAAGLMKISNDLANGPAENLQKQFEQASAEDVSATLDW